METNYDRVQNPSYVVLQAAQDAVLVRTNRHQAAPLYRWLGNKKTTVARDEHGPVNWLRLQGQYLGVAVAYFYLVDFQEEGAQVVAAEDGGFLPAIDLFSDGWKRERQREVKILNGLIEARSACKRIEFYPILAGEADWRRVPEERDLDIIFCPDGEVSTFLFEWALRKEFDAERHDLDVQSTKIWLKKMFSPKGRMRRICLHLSLIDLEGNLTGRGRRLLSWVEDTARKEEQGKENRFVLKRGLPSWSSAFYDEAIRTQAMMNTFLSTDGEPVAKLQRLASRMLSRNGRERMAEDPQNRARFNLQSHWDLRWDDQGHARNVLAFTLFQGASRVLSPEKKPIGFVAMGTHLDDPFNNSNLENHVRAIRPTLTIIAHQAIVDKYGGHLEERAKNLGLVAGAHTLRSEINPLKFWAGVFQKEQNLAENASWSDLYRRIRWLDETTTAAADLSKDPHERLPNSQFKRVNLRIIIAHACERLDLQRVEGIAVNIDVPDIWVQGHPDYLRIMFQEMFRNSADAIESKGNSPGFDGTISVHAEKSDRDYVVVTVADSGEGDQSKLPLGDIQPGVIDQKISVGLNLIVNILKRHHMGVPKVTLSDPVLGTKITFRLMAHPVN